MGVVFGNRPCLDPMALWDRARYLDLPVDHWFGKPNAFRALLGQEPGRGYVLMMFQDLNSLNLNEQYDLTFNITNLASQATLGGNPAQSVTLQNLVIVRGDCITPSQPLAPDSAYLVELADRRCLCRNVPINKAYNLRTSDWSYVLSTVVGVNNPWTWDGVCQDLWDTIGKMGSYPGLPYQPTSVPEGLTFWAVSAYDALGDLLREIECLLQYDPITDTFGIVQLGAANAALAALEAKRKGIILWDTQTGESARANCPAGVLVTFRKVPAVSPTSGVSPFYTIAVAGPVPGTEPSTQVVLSDDLYAQINNDGSVNNSSALTARANSRAAAYFQSISYGQSHKDRVYQGLITDAGARPGSRIIGTLWEDRGEGYKTEIARWPIPMPALQSRDTGSSGGPGLVAGSSVFFGGTQAGPDSVGNFLGLATNNSCCAEPDFHYYRQAGTSPLTVNYPGLIPGASAPGSGGYAASPGAGNTILATPFIVPRPLAVDKLKIFLALPGPSGCKVRLGIYAATSTSNLWPSQLIADSGDLAADGSPGYLTASVSVTLQGGTLYWLALLCDSNAPPLQAPIGVTFADYTGGSLPDNTDWQYLVSAVLSSGETTPGGLDQVVTSVSPVLGFILSWNAFPLALSYNIYRYKPIDGNVNSLIANVSAGTLTYTDTGGSTSSGTPVVQTSFMGPVFASATNDVPCVLGVSNTAPEAFTGALAPFSYAALPSTFPAVGSTGQPGNEGYIGQGGTGNPPGFSIDFVSTTWPMVMIHIASEGS